MNRRGANPNAKRASSGSGRLRLRDHHTGDPEDGRGRIARPEELGQPILLGLLITRLRLGAPMRLGLLITRLRLGQPTDDVGYAGETTADPDAIRE